MGNNVEKELKELRLERENDKRTHQEERENDKRTHQEERENDKRTHQEERENDKQTHQEEMIQKKTDLEKTNQEIAFLKKNHQIRNKLTKIKPGDSGNSSTDIQFPNRLFISLFGETGTGKTSLINSLNYAIDGELKDTKIIQTAHEDYHGAHTMDSLEVVLTDHLSVIDNRGGSCKEEETTPLHQDAIKKMEGKYKKGEVTWQSIAPSQGKEADKTSYCSVIVFSARNANVVRQYRSFIHHLREWQGHFPLAVITNVDQVSSKDVRLALETGGIGGIFEVANITSGRNGRDTLTPEHQYQLLQLLEKCFNDGDMIFRRRQQVGGGE